MNKTNLLIDITILSALLLVNQPHLTGLPIHEWLGVAFGGALLLHILLHRKWVAAVGRRFFQNLLHPSRRHFIIDAGLFVTFSLAIISGIIISRNVLLVIGIVANANRAWKMVHALSANAALILAALHVILHWKWIFNRIKRYIIVPLHESLPSALKP